MKTFPRILCVCISMVLLTSCTAHITVEPEISPSPTATLAPDSSAASAPSSNTGASESAPTATPTPTVDPTTSSAPTAAPSPVQSRTFDPSYFIQEFSRSTARAVLEEKFPDLREQPNPPQSSDPEDLILISEGWNYEEIPGVVLVTCADDGQLRQVSFHGYGADFEKFVAMRDALKQQLEQSGLMKSAASSALEISEAMDMGNHGEWVPFSEDSSTLPSSYVISTALQLSDSVNLSLIYVGEEEASFWYSSLYEATGELSVRKNANPATDFCISLNYT